jgi:hypothetical protein
MIDSNIAASTITTASLLYADRSSAGDNFGLAGDFIGKVSYKDALTKSTVNTTTSTNYGRLYVSIL